MSHTAETRALGDLHEVALDVVWRQWRAVGGSAASREGWHSIVDPEALVLASLFLSDREPRLSDILASWVELNAPLLSAQRLRNAQKRFPSAISARVATFVSQARTLQKHPRWHSFTNDQASGIPDAGKGVRRATRAPRTGNATLLLRLRAALSVGVKADVLAVVLGSARPVSVRDLGDLLGYTNAGTRLAVEDLAYAGFVVAAGGRPAQFTAPQAQWQSLLDVDRRPTWTPWLLWFSLTADILSWHETVLSRGVSEYVRDVGLRERFEAHSAFFRLAAHELRPSAVAGTVGRSVDAIEEVTAWARERSLETA